MFTLYTSFFLLTFFLFTIYIFLPLKSLDRNSILSRSSGFFPLLSPGMLCVTHVRIR